MWIADIVRSAKQIRSQSVHEELDSLCDELETAEQQNTRLRGLILEKLTPWTRPLQARII